MNIFWGMKILWIFLGVITKGVISMRFRIVSKGQGVLDIPDNFGE